MLLSLIACSSADEEDIRGEITTKENETKNPDNETDPESETEPEAETEPQFAFGSFTGNRYHSDFLGLTVNLADEWRFYSEEEILEINNLTMDYYDEEAAAIIENATLIYDMYAVNEYTGSSTTVILEKLSALQIVALDYKTTIEAQFDTLRSTFENMGYSDVEMEYKKITVDGEEIDGFELVADIMGIKYYSTTLMFRRGSYLISISVNSFEEGGTQEILAGFDFE